MPEFDCVPDFQAPKGDPCHPHNDGTWWFWNEVWADELGPYQSEAECLERLRAYGRFLETGVVE